MASEYQKYTIEKGDCLSLLAQKFNVTVDELKELNSEQIKNIDLIYTGKEINVPGGSPNQPIKDGATTDLPSPPSDCASGNDLCKTSPEYVDILYVPAHPKTGKKCYYAITKAAQTAILQEQKTLVSAIHPNDSEKTLQDLNDLGVFSNFYTSPHGAFLTVDDRNRYDFLVLALTTVKTGAYLQKEDFLENLAEKELSTDDFKFLYDENLEKYELQIELSKPSNWYSIRGGNTVYEYIKKSAKTEINRKKAIDKIKNELINNLEEKINSFEDKAQHNAKNIKSDDGSYYVYNDDKKYYTSVEEKNIEASFNYIKESIKYNKILLQSFSDDAFALSSHYFAKGKCKSFNNIIFKSLPNNSNREFKEKLKFLNSHGFLLKEQCLTYEELEGSDDTLRGPKTFRESFDDWREEGANGSGLPIDITEADSLIDKIFNDISIDFSTISKRELSGKIALTDEDAIKTALIETGADKWTYYPTIALIKVIDSTLLKWNSDLKGLLSSHSDLDNKKVKKIPLPKVFSGLLWVKKLAKERLNQIRKLAEDRARNRKSIKLLDDEGCKLVKSFKVIWDETEYSAKKKTESQIKEGNDYIRVIECVLMSVGDLGWVRGPAWYLPEDKEDIKKANGHLKDITKKIAIISNLSNSSALKGKEALKDFDSFKKVMKEDFSDATKKSMKENIIGGKFLLDPYNLLEKKKIVDSAFWSGSYHWEEGFSPNKLNSEYVVDASAQLFRFTANSQTNINLPLSKYEALEPNTNTEFSGEIKMSFELFKSQLTFDAWYPVQEYNESKKEHEGKEFFLYYNTSVKDSPEPYSLGFFFVHLSAVVYGTAAVSVAVSRNVQFGYPDNRDGKIGVRGSAYSLSDYVKSDGSHPKYNKYMRTPVNVPRALGKHIENNRLIAGDMDFKVDVFAGVEAGGMIEGEIYWQPPEVTFNGYTVKDKIMKLGKLSVEAAVSFGAGVSGELRITMHNGAIYMIVAARWVTGPGATGKIAIEVDYLSIDRLFKHILDVYYRNGFESLSSIGEYSDPIISKDNIGLATLNTYLTYALFLGLNIGEVLLLPAKFLENKKYESLKDDYGPMLARNIIDKENQKNTQMWVQQLSPEVLAKLLDCLSDVDDLTDLTVDNAKVLVEKLDAIVKVLGWIKDKSGQEETKTYHQYELTMSLIGGDGILSNITYVRWYNIYKGWIKISRVVAMLNKIENYAIDYLKSSIIINPALKKNMLDIRDYLAGDLRDLRLKYNTVCGTLSKNIVLYYKGDCNFIDFIFSRYNLESKINYNEVIVIGKESSRDTDEDKLSRCELLDKIKNEKWINKKWLI